MTGHFILYRHLSLALSLFLSLDRSPSLRAYNRPRLPCVRIQRSKQAVNQLGKKKDNKQHQQGRRCVLVKIQTEQDSRWRRRQLRQGVSTRVLSDHRSKRSLSSETEVERALARSFGKYWLSTRDDRVRAECQHDVFSFLNKPISRETTNIGRLFVTLISFRPARHH